MSSRRPRRPLVVRPGRSVALAGFLCVIHGAALLSVLWSQMALGLQALAGLVIAGSLVYHWRDGVLRRGRRSVVAAEWLPDGGWRLRFARGGSDAGHLSDSSIVLPWLLILSFRCEENGRVHLVLPADALDAETARRVRVRLRTDGGREANGVGASGP